MKNIPSNVLAAFLAASAVLACSDPLCNNPNLPSEPGTIIVGVVDSISAQPVAGGAGGHVASSSFADSLTHSNSYPDSVLYSTTTAGTFLVTVDRPGYVQWVARGVVVTPSMSACYGPPAVRITARLQPIP